jgi:DNA-binding XRE family transcriptional regulator
MRAPVDLHPDDTAMRHMIRDLLIGLRYRTKPRMGQRQLAARIGCHQTSVAGMEASTSWKASTLQRWARAHNRRLILTPIGLPADPGIDPAAIIYTDPVKADEWTIASTIALITEARRLAGITPEAVADLLGVGTRALWAIENQETDPLLASIQRYCRAVGGALWVGVEALPADEVTP